MRTERHYGRLTLRWVGGEPQRLKTPGRASHGLEECPALNSALSFYPLIQKEQTMYSKRKSTVDPQKGDPYTENYKTLL